MNYYEHHLGDYLRDTAHLSMLEDGAYRRLLDAYYIREAPLPLTMRDVFRLVRAQSKQDREAVETVLREFFTETPEGWAHSRCDREIAAYRETIPEREAKRENDRERQRRARERRKSLFEALRGHGIVPPFDTTTGELEALLSRAERRDSGVTVTQPVTRDNTATHTQTPDTTTQNIPPIPPEGGDGAGGQEPVTPGIPSRYGEVVLAMKAAGMPPTLLRPHDQTFRALVDAGATPEEFAAVVPAAMAKDKPWPYVIAVVEGERKRAAETSGVIHRGPLRVVGKQAALEAHNRTVGQQWAATIKGGSDAS